MVIADSHILARFVLVRMSTVLAFRLNQVSFERVSMSAPKISLNNLGEYMNANPARRRRIIEDWIALKEFIAALYSDNTRMRFWLYGSLSVTHV